MEPTNLEILRLPKGGYKVFIFGHADGHVMDWRGCNYRIVPVSGQPGRGTTLALALRLLDTIEGSPERKQAEFRAARYIAGKHLGDNSPYTFPPGELVRETRRKMAEAAKSKEGYNHGN